MGDILPPTLTEADQKLVAALQARYKAAADKATIIPPSGGSGNTKNASAAASIDTAQRVIDSLQRQKDLIGATQLEIAESNALWRAGSKATDDQKAQIVQLVDAIYAADEAHKEEAATLKEVSDAGRDFTGTFIDDLVQGKSATEALTDALGQLAKRLENLALDQIFGTGGTGGGAILGTVRNLHECIY
jgi:hypothetical protein